MSCLFLDFVFYFCISVTQTSADFSKHLWLAPFFSPSVTQACFHHWLPPETHNIKHLGKFITADGQKMTGSEGKPRSDSTHHFRLSLTCIINFFPVPPSHSSCLFRSDTNFFPWPVHGHLGIILVIYVHFWDFSF